MAMQFDDGMERLGRDVSFLGRVLGDVLREQGGDELFDAVESLRRATRHHRQYHCGEAAEEVQELVDGLSLERARDVVRAFTMYFHLINIAEENHRLRRLADRERALYPDPRPESIAETIRLLRSRGVSRDEAGRLIGSLAIRPVFTAHPTEARRMTLLRQLQRIAVLVQSLDADPAPQERARLTTGLYAEVTDLWQTNELRFRSQTPMDEIRNGLYYFDESVFDVTAAIYRDLHDALRDTYPNLLDDLPPFLTFGSWIGGDRDGNPFVTAELTERTLRMHKALVLSKYVKTVRRLVDLLTSSSRLTGCSDELRASLSDDAAAFGGVAGEIEERWSEEPYRQKLSFIWRRLRATEHRNGMRWTVGLDEGVPHTEDPPYQSAEEFRDDLRLVAESLCTHCGDRIAADALQDLRWQALSFGFHLARLDVRQHRDRHRAALDEIVPGETLSALDDRSLTERLETLLLDPVALPPLDSLSADTRETLATFDVIRRMQDELGHEAVDTYIISFTGGPADLLTVLYLATVSGLCRLGEGQSRLRVVPLFETAGDLEAAPEIMRSLYRSPVYRRQLDAWDGEQEIMLGYSDSDKDAGYVSSNVWLYRAQQNLARQAHDESVRVTFFHGRGGAIGRGGGPLHRAILGQPPGTVQGRIKVTEQGEVLFTRYANAGIARRHLEQLVDAVIRSSLPPPEPSTREAEWEDMVGRLSEVAEEAYSRLVRSDPQFLRFFEEGTPLRSIMRLRIASRPASRHAGNLRFEDLRAIPWVFAWTQARWGVPGWFGLGTALRSEIDDGRLDLLVAMYHGWPFFRWLIDAAQISLGKADLGVASSYSRLVTDSAVRDRYTAGLQEEFERTVAAVNAVMGQERLLDSWPILQRSIALRNPYVDPMSYLQVRCIRELRSSESEGEQDLLRSIVDRSVAGIAAGLQNTG